MGPLGFWRGVSGSILMNSTFGDELVILWIGAMPEVRPTETPNSCLWGHSFCLCEGTPQAQVMFLGTMGGWGCNFSYDKIGNRAGKTVLEIERGEVGGIFYSRKDYIRELLKWSS